MSCAVKSTLSQCSIRVASTPDRGDLRYRRAGLAKRKAFALRIEEKTLAAMQRWANDDLRSLNAQIEYVLRESLRKAGRLPTPGQDAADREGDDS